MLENDVLELAHELGVDLHYTSLTKNTAVNQWLEPFIIESYEFQSKLMSQVNSDAKAY